MGERDDDRMMEALERLERAINRFCVIAERQLASTDNASRMAYERRMGVTDDIKRRVAAKTRGSR